MDPKCCEYGLHRGKIDLDHVTLLDGVDIAKGPRTPKVKRTDHLCQASHRDFIHFSRCNNSIAISAATMPVQFLHRMVRPSVIFKNAIAPAQPLRPSFTASIVQRTPVFQPLPASRAHKCTLIQVLRHGRIAQKARKLRSPQLAGRPELKGVCLKVGTTKPKKPNSGERKIARVRLSSGKVITAYIPGEGVLSRSEFPYGSENGG